MAATTETLQYTAHTVVIEIISLLFLLCVGLCRWIRICGVCGTRLNGNAYAKSHGDTEKKLY